MKNKNEKISRHCGRGSAIQGCYKEKTTLLNRLDPGSMPGMTTRSAFTLIELLVVVLIIGILAAIAVPQYQKAVGKARLMESVVQGRALMTAQKEYILASGSFTTDLSTLAIDLPSGAWDCTAYWCKGPKIQGAQIQITGSPISSKMQMDCITDGPKENNLCKTLGATFDYSHENGYDYYNLIPFM